MGIIVSLILALLSIVDPTGGYITASKTQTTVNATTIVDPTGGYLTSSQTTVNATTIVDPTGGY